MEKITNLYENCKNIENLIKKRDKRSKKRAMLIKEKELLQKEILETENEVNLTNRYEEDLQNLEKEIKKLQIVSKNITNIDELDEILDDEILMLKCKMYIDSLICVWQENDEKTIVISKNIKPFFEKVRMKNCYKECKTYTYSKLKTCLQGFLLSNVKFEDHRNEIYICKGEETNFVDFYKSNKEISNFIFTILINNLKDQLKALITDKQVGYRQIFANSNNLIKGTKFYITEVDSFFDALFLEVINDIACKERYDIKVDRDIAEYNFSEEFAVILFCIDNFTNAPDHKTLQVILLNFYDLDKIEKNLFSYLCIYSELTYLIAKYKFDKMVNIKENVCALIIKHMDIDKVEFGLPFSQQKLTIGSHYYAFKEVLEFFISDTTRIIFMAVYFDELCDKFYHFVVAKQNITIQESEVYVEIIHFIFEISGIEKTLNYYCKMNCLEFVLKSNLVEVEQCFMNGSICLDVNDVCKLLQALFNNTEKRYNIIKKLRNSENNKRAD